MKKKIGRKREEEGEKGKKKILKKKNMRGRRKRGGRRMGGERRIYSYYVFNMSTCRECGW